MAFNKIRVISVGADYTVSKINPDYESGFYAALSSFIIHI
jgi:hypothetical protein